MWSRTEQECFFFSLLVRLALSFSCNYERVPVYSALHLQPDLHVCFNHALRNKNGMNQLSVKLKICIGVKSSVKIQNRTLFCLYLCYTYHDGRDTIRYQLNLVLLLLLLICSAPNHQSEWDLSSERSPLNQNTTPERRLSTNHKSETFFNKADMKNE